jgi:hypothetical protein
LPVPPAANGEGPGPRGSSHPGWSRRCLLAPPHAAPSGTAWPGQGREPGRLDLCGALTGSRRRQLPRWCSADPPLRALLLLPPTASLSASACLHAGPAVAAAALAVTQAAHPVPAWRGVLACSCHLAWRGTTRRRCITPTHHHHPPRTGGAAAMGGSITSSNAAGGREVRPAAQRLAARRQQQHPCGTARCSCLSLLDDSSSSCHVGGP